MKLKRFLTASLMAIITTAMVFSINAASAAGTYGISCKNDAYGMQLGSHYTDVAYVYNAGAVGVTAGGTPTPSEQYTIGGPNGSGHEGAYVGNDCIYAGSADTNGTAVVAGDVARLAINAIVGAVNNRIDMAYAANNSGASATGLSFSTQSDGLAMSANKIIGGLSFWGDFGSNSFENTQTYSNARIDSMNYDGNASSYSLGIDKVFGKALIGVVVSNLDTDLNTTFNSGTYDQQVDSYGIYMAYRTSIIHIDLGMGQGDSTINTTRIDLGNDQIITGSTTADMDYANARIAATITRGRFSIVPSASYRSVSMDLKAFTDDRPDDLASSVSGGEDTIFSTGNDTLTVTDDQIAARSIENETMSVGLKLSANYGKIVPYLDISYDSEDTTKAVFKDEAGTDGNDNEQDGTNYSSSMKIGGGINFMLGSHIKGGVRAGSISGRDDWEEDYVAGSISLGF